MTQYLIIDSREKPKAISKILDYFNICGVQYETSKLLFGDYMEYSNPLIVVDRKQNFVELAKNCTTDHERFRRELERAKKAGAKLVILVEQNRFSDRGKTVKVETIEDLLLWSNPHTMVTGERVFRILSSWINKYDLEVQFCDKRNTGKRILQIIYGGNNER